MKVLIAVLVFAGSTAQAADVFFVNGKQVTVIEAIRTLQNDSKAEVLKCQPQEIKMNKTNIGLKKRDS